MHLLELTARAGQRGACQAHRCTSSPLLQERVVDGGLPGRTGHLGLGGREAANHGGRTQRPRPGFRHSGREPAGGALGMLFVEPDAIGQGVGRRLFEHAVAAAGDLGFARLTIDADPNAEPFYLAMGVTRIGATPSGAIPGRLLPLLAITIVGRDAEDEIPVTDLSS
ncbi:GNAT family N-acetyltransferase [Streptosporangium sp. NPDC002544]|uniref:GNAT family N-acetyltransferase n=1 Tax=Streptosporangium sp. NPDC002544 TaxID=3154538 RepID=UPI00331719B9